MGPHLTRRTALLAAATASFAPAALAQPDDARTIARDAWLYAYAMLQNYQTMHKQALETGSREYVGGFNVFRHYSTYFTADNHDVVTPNNDTPYSWAWLDLRAEPVVLSVPAVPRDRYYVFQFFDLFTANFAYVGVRATGYEAGDYLFVPPGWNGTVPPGIRQVFRPETQIVGVLGRTSLAGPDDIPTLRAIQAQYRLRPLSAFTNTAPPPAPAAVVWPAWDERKALGPEFISYLNALLAFYPTPVPSEVPMLERFARIGIGAGRPFDLAALPPELREAITAGAAEAQASLRALEARTSSAVGLFGTREELGPDYIAKRSVGAAMGLYGNSAAEAVYVGARLDADGQPLTAGRRYEITFPRDALPPASIFWSATLYALPSRQLIANPLNRYAIGSRTGVQPAADGSITLYLQRESPGPERESNWIPTTEQGQFDIVLRLYGPSEAAQRDEWKLPPVRRVG